MCAKKKNVEYHWTRVVKLCVLAIIIIFPRVIPDMIPISFITYDGINYISEGVSGF
jgi:hypothetical protein